ncbi:CYTH and CHAD domain-containing protein, partial [Sphaerisporangium rufum]|uniref:CYTH and CHAD domain-containing protein n=1 Tax=Sphaerisporangium rufum TaxID=1381558 RepID=UPI00194FFB89
AGRPLAEVADDRVRGTVLAAAGDADRRVERWREIEVELAEGDAKLLRRAGKALRAAGATPAATGSKLARLLGPLVPAAGPPVGPPAGTAGQVVYDYLRAQVDALYAQDPQVRRAGPDAVHQMRVASRRLRSALKSFAAVVPETGALQDELKWIAGVLGEARDLEVIRERFAGSLAGLDETLVVPPVRERLGGDLAERERAALARAHEAMSGDRYHALLDRLDAMILRPPLAPLAARPAGAALPKILRKEWRRVERRYAAARAIEDAARREIAMHDVRKAAKRARYTAEALAGPLGAEAAAMARRAKTVQKVLGEYQDGVVAQQILVEEAGRARAAGEDTFTYGVLAGLERAAAERSHQRFPEVWAEVTG